MCSPDADSLLMPTMHCTEAVCRHEWSEPTEPRRPQCPRCGGFWVRVDPCVPRATPGRGPAPLAAMRSVSPLTFR